MDNIKKANFLITGVKEFTRIIHFLIISILSREVGKVRKSGSREVFSDNETCS